jgi:hypothetical protein
MAEIMKAMLYNRIGVTDRVAHREGDREPRHYEVSDNYRIVSTQTQPPGRPAFPLSYLKWRIGARFHMNYEKFKTG